MSPPSPPFCNPVSLLTTVWILAVKDWSAGRLVLLLSKTVVGLEAAVNWPDLLPHSVKSPAPAGVIQSTVEK